MCVCVCVCVCMRIYTYIHIYVACYLPGRRPGPACKLACRCQRYINISICLSVHLSIKWSIHLYIYTSIYLSIYLFVYIYIYVFIYIPPWSAAGPGRHAGVQVPAWRVRLTRSLERFHHIVAQLLQTDCGAVRQVHLEKIHECRDLRVGCIRIRIEFGLQEACIGIRVGFE